MVKLPSLRALLLADAATCAAMGLTLDFDAGPIAALTGLPETLLLGAGLALLPVAAFMTLVAWRLHPAAVWLIVAGNLGWTVGSLLLLVSGWVSPNTLGVTFVVMQAIAVAILTKLEFLALRARTSATALPNQPIQGFTK